MVPYLKYLLTIAFISGIIFCLHSCRKEKLSNCSGNCSELIIAGLIYDKTTNIPLSNQNINVSLHQNPGCLICSNPDIISGKTGKDGRFRLTTEFDTTLLRDNYLIVSSPIPANYLLYPEPIGPLTPANTVQSSSIVFYSLDSTAINNDSASISNIHFGIYPMAPLHMNFHRSNAAIAFQTLDLEINFDDKNMGWGFYITNTNRDTTLTINTAANIFTKITSVKYISPSNIISQTDSIKCVVNGNNNIDIYY
jgi:hypothetical protein